MGVWDKSVHIASDHAVTVYALHQRYQSTDATNILPITALGVEYYQISYTAYPAFSLIDAYAVVATESNTQIKHDGIPITPTLNAGQVYYCTSSDDMTGAHITSDKPIAFFAVNQGTLIPEGYSSIDHLFQQLTPVHTWGYNFFCAGVASWRRESSYYGIEKWDIHHANRLNNRKPKLYPKCRTMG